MQDEMVRALRSLQKGQNLMASIMTQVQREQEEERIQRRRIQAQVSSQTHATPRQRSGNQVVQGVTLNKNHPVGEATPSSDDSALRIATNNMVVLPVPQKMPSNNT